MRGAWRTLRTALFERGGFTAIFDHTRNLVVATIVVAAGADAMNHPSSSIFRGVVNIQFASYLIMAAGLLLIALNLMDGLNKLSKVRRPIGWRIVLVIAYLILSFRMAQMIVAFRGVYMG